MANSLKYKSSIPSPAQERRSCTVFDSLGTGFFIMQKEQWKRVNSYEDRYLISNHGRVLGLPWMQISPIDHKTKFYHKLKLLKPTQSVYGYSMVNLSNKCITKIKSVHRLVALHFIPNPQGKPQTNHKDGNKQNNHIDNLEWVTPSENQLHAFVSGLNKQKKGLNHILSKQIYQLNNNKIIAEYGSQKEASRETGIQQGNISRACRNSVMAGGYQWKFKINN